jgi:hypothetical protein
LAELLDNELTQTIRRKIYETLPAFRDIDSNRTSSTSESNGYYSTQITRFITEHVLLFLAQGRPLSFDNSLEKRKKKQLPNQSESFYPWIITSRTWVNTPLIESITEIQLEQFHQILLGVINEGEIMKKFQRIHEIDDIDVGQSIDDFEKHLQELVEDIDEPKDDYPIRGECEKCNDWNK